MRKVFVFLALWVSAVVYAQQRRVALIIGNDKYSGHFSTLHSPVNDAIAMNNVLRKIGFETIVGINIRRDSMSTYLKKFGDLANGAEMALFYYSGHAGIDNKDHFYLAPSGTYSSVASLTEDCYSFSSVEEKVRRIGAPIKFYIIDACRNSIDDSKGMINEIGPETIKKYVTNTKGNIYWFATDLSKVARTGVGKYSLFTESVLNHISDFDNLDVVWNKISDEVTRSDREQVPHREETSGLSEKIRLNPNKIIVYPINKEGIDYYSIITKPSYASISIKDKKQREINKTDERYLLHYGETYNVIVSAIGHKTYDKNITVTPYKTTYGIILDTLAKARINIQSSQKGSIAYFDGERKGSLPVDIDTYAGTHDIRIECSGYEIYNARPNLGAGYQTYYAQLKKHYPWMWSWSDDLQHYVSYHFSSMNQIGISYLFRPDQYRFSFGAIFGVSTGLFRGLGAGETESKGSGVNSTNEYTDTYTCSFDETYSSLVDPNNEAKHYDASALLLANLGYSPCNGILLEVGLGAGYHGDKYYMDNAYETKKTIRTNRITGENTELPLEYLKTSTSRWYNQNSKWSPALRLGTRFVIPLISDNNLNLLLGLGYTYLLTNHEYSCFDFNIGLGWGI